MSAAAPTEPRVLLVDIVVVDRFHCGLMLPYVHGFLRQRDVASALVRFGLRAGEVAAAGGAGAELPPRALAALRRELDAFAPTHVLLGHEPGPALRAELARPPAGGAAAPATAWTAYELFSVHTGPSGRAPLLPWLGFPGGEAAHAALLAAPDFAAQARDERAAAWRPLPFLICGPECSYRGSVAANPFYEGLDTGACRRTRGCAFCHLYMDDGVPRGLGLEVVAEQLRRALAVPAEGRRRFRVLGYRVMARVDDFAALLSGLGVRRTDVLFSVRADEVLRTEARLRRALARLEADGDGNRLQLFLVGVENFSQAELDRLNKGLRAPELFDMVRLLRALERLHPTSFDYTEYGGFSTILYTPWTALEDLAINLAAVQHLGIERTCGKLLNSRLRLYGDLPLTLRARADGLLAESYEDPLFDTARRNAYHEEVPWRFLHPAAALFNRVAARFDADDSLAGDALFERVKARHGGAPLAGRAAVAAARRLLDEVARGPAEPEALVDRVLGRAAGRGGAAAAPRPAPAAAAPAPVELGRALRPEEQLRPPGLVLMELGARPVGRVEYVAPAAVPRLETWLRERLGRGLVVSGTARSDGTLDVLYGPDAAAVREVARLLAVIDRPDGDQAELRAASAAVGRLLGYPPCCADAFAALSFFELRYNEWTHLRLRAEHPGAVPPDVHPFEGLTAGHVPCSVLCPETLRQAAAVRAALARRDPALLDALLDRARRPTAFLLDVFGSYAVLDGPLAEDGGPYRLLARVGADPRLAAFAEGDRVRLAPGLLAVAAGTRPIATYALSCAVWWHERAFHADAWLAAARAGFLAGAEDAAGPGLPGESEAGPQPADDRSRLSRRLRNALRVVETYAGPIAERTGYQLRSCRGVADEVHVELAAGGERLALVLRDAAGPRRLALGGRFVTSGPLGAAPEGSSPAAARTLRFVHRLVESVMERREDADR